MHYLRQPWIGCALASLLIHGTVLYAVLPWKGSDRVETIQVSLVTEELSFRSPALSHEPRVLRPLKVRPKAKDVQTRGIPRPEQPAANIETAKVPVQSTSPLPERLANSAVPDHSDSQPLPGPPVKAASGGSGNVATQQGSSKDTAYGSNTSGTAVAASNKGSKSGAGERSTGHGTVEFGGPEGPRFMHREIPEYPLYARRRKKEGKVLLMVHITENGKLSSVDVVEASDPIFVGPSIDAIKRSTFAPATQKGTPIAVNALLPIRFTLDEQVTVAQNRSSL
jgi:TonB family protein